MAQWLASAMSLTRRTAQNYILSGLRRGLPGSQVIGVLQQQGLWYKSTDFGEDWRHMKAGWESGQLMKHTTLDARIGADRYMENRWLLTSHYQTVMEVRGFDLRTGEDFTRNMTISHTHIEDGMTVADTDQRLTRRELEEKTRDALGQYPWMQEIEIEEIMPVIGYYNPELV